MPIASNQCVTDGKVPTAAELCSSTGSQLIRGALAGCQAYTYASLKHVKCIRFSRGSMNRPREANEISGLWLDYFDGPSKIVGQWLSEVDRMDLAFGERVAEISVCSSKLGSSKLGSFVSKDSRFGRLISIFILTCNQSKTVQWDRSKDDYVTYKFRENRLERLVGLSPYSLAYHIRY